MSAESSRETDREASERSLTTAIDIDDLGDSVLFVGPAMAGKQLLAMELLSDVTRAFGHPFAVTTTQTPAHLTALYHQQRNANDDLRELIIIECLPERSAQENGENVYTGGSPGDLSGIAMAVSDAFDNTPGRDNDGPRLLVDNLATLLLYANVETVTRFVHALLGRVTQQDGVLVSTLDTDGVGDEERQTMSRLFDSVVEVRHVDTATELRVQNDGQGWRQLGTHGGEN